MTRQPDIQYVQFSFDGTAARKLETSRTEARQPQRVQNRRRQRKRKIIRIDPLALCAMVTAGVMLIVMAVGMLRLGSINQDAAKMEAYVSKLQTEQTQLQSEYRDSFDQEEIRQKALAIGLVPRQTGEQITISVQVPPVQEEQTVWDQIGTFLAGLFA